MIRTPKERFLASSHKAVFERLVQSESFEEATLAALLHMQHEQPLKASPNEMASSAERMSGARQYLEFLCEIHLAETKPKRTEEKTLDYDRLS